MEVGEEGDYNYVYRYTVTTRMTPALKMGSDESHFHVSLTAVRDKVTRLSTNHNLFEEKGEPKRYGTEILLLTSLKEWMWGKKDAIYFVIHSSGPALDQPQHFLSDVAGNAAITDRALTPRTKSLVCVTSVTNKHRLVCVDQTQPSYVKGDQTVINRPVLTHTYM